MKRKAISARLGALTNVMEAAIAQAIALPREAQPVRMRDEFTADQTALYKVFSRPKPDWPDAVTPGQVDITPRNQYSIVLFRDPLRNFIINYKNNARIPATYVWQTRFGDGTFDLPRNSETKLQTSRGAYFGGPKYHGDFLYAGEDQLGDKYLWVDGSDIGAFASALTVTNQTALVIGDRIVLQLYRYGQGAIVYVDTVEFVAAGAVPIGTLIASFPIPLSDYYRIQANFTPAAGNAIEVVTVSVNENINGEIMGHNALPGIDANSFKVTALRNIGVSCLIQNQSADQFASGSVVGVQFGKGADWTAQWRTSTPYDNLTIQKQEVNLNLKEGFYAYLKPQEENDLAFRVPFELDRGSVIPLDANFKLFGESFVYIAMSVASGSTNNKDLQLNFDMNGEYTTEDMWTNTAPAVATPDNWTNALMVISSMEQFYSNPIHWRRIINTIGKFVKIGAPLLRLFPQTAPAAIPVGLAGSIAEQLSQ